MARDDLLGRIERALEQYSAANHAVTGVLCLHPDDVEEVGVALLKSLGTRYRTDSTVKRGSVSIQPAGKIYV